MVLSKKRKIMAVVLLAAVAALVADRFLGVIPMGPDEAEASPADEYAIIEPAAAPAAAEVSGPAAAAVPSVTLAERLERLAAAEGFDGSEVRDAFQAPASWVPQSADAAGGGAPNLDEARIQAYQESHRLRATSVGVRGRMALIDDECLTVGQMLDGFRLEAVDSNAAVLVSGSLRVVLRLPTDADARRTQE